MKTAIFTVTAALIATAATATPLLPGGSVSPIPVYGTTLNAATPVAPTFISNFTSPGGHYTGQLRSGVFTNCADNPFGLGFLTFAYVLLNDVTSTDALGRFTVNGFGTTSIDSGSEPLTANPAYTDAFENTRQADGDSVGWTFVELGMFSRMMPGDTSRIFVLHTNATTYGINAASVINGDIATAQAYAPLPTPGAAALLGLGGLAIARRRR
ncbi:MAG TPA: hypothetical protein VEB22_10615 [Phycisphaerales bacterium]|nr:hypothetical protein [Phycisphaerales bacterium]